MKNHKDNTHVMMDLYFIILSNDIPLTTSGGNSKG